MNKLIEFKGCKHLIFDRSKIDSRCEIVSLPGGCGAYWKRDQNFIEGIPWARRDVQFCSLRGRLNSKVACLKGMAECSDYEEVTHIVVVDVVDE